MISHDKTPVIRIGEKVICVEFQVNSDDPMQIQ